MLSDVWVGSWADQARAAVGREESSYYYYYCTVCTIALTHFLQASLTMCAIRGTEDKGVTFGLERDSSSKTIDASSKHGRRPKSCWLDIRVAS